MQFIDNLNEKEYINFFNSQSNTHFLQSYEWGQTQKETRNQIPCYVGLKDDNNKIVAAALLLKKKTPLNMCYYYAPRGFVIDYENEELFKTFVDNLKTYLKNNNAIYLKVDPGIKYQDINDDASKKENGSNNYKIFDEFINSGFKHQGFYKLYEGNQPRYTIRINLKQPWDTIENSISKTFMKTVRKSNNYDLEIKQSDDIKTFHDLILNNANKNDFKAYSLNYYQSFYDNFKKYNDFYGHLKGDDCLRRIAATFKKAFAGHNGYVIRYGGDEFIAVVFLVERKLTLELGDKICRLVENEALPDAEGGVVTVSIGMCHIQSTVDVSLSECIRIADKALYQAKTSGKNRAVMLDAPQQAPGAAAQQGISDSTPMG